MEIHIGRDGQLVGVYPHGSIASQIEMGQILPTDLAWVPGEPDWLTLEDFARKHGVSISVQRESNQPSCSDAHVSPAAAVNARSCPRCESKNTKKIASIIRAGTTDFQASSSVSGTAYVGSASLPVSGRRTDSGTSQTRLAAMLSEELQMDEASSGSFVGVIFLVVGVAAGFYAGRYSGSSIVGWVVGIVALVSCGAVYMNIKPRKATAEANERLNNWREHGRYCHQCELRYIPGSSEAYPYLSDGTE